jgi:hypothetical protein
VAALIILALAGVIVYLLSLLNSKRYFLAPEGDQLVVKKGIFFVTGSDRFRSNEPSLAGLYDPVELPSGYRAGLMAFEDLPSLNAELATIMLESARPWVFATEENLHLKGVAYLRRLGRMNGLSQTQLRALESLNAEVDYLEARSAYLGVERTLEDALRKFKKARLNEESRFQDTEAWIAKVERLLTTIRDIKAGLRPEAAPTPEPALRPEPAPAPEPVSPAEP